MIVTRSPLAPARGTKDLLGAEWRQHQEIVRGAAALAAAAGYHPLSTPILEPAELFSRSLGATSDVISKEMFLLAPRPASAPADARDQSLAQLCLRPEGTAAVVRAALTSKWSGAQPFKAFYAGAMFRRERPQKGRLRQFHQFGIELLGTASWLGDVEIIALAATILEALGITGLRLEINSLGDRASRSAYQAALVPYFQRHASALSEISRRRLEINPLRILDSKDAGDQEVAAGAPDLGDFLNPESQEIFRQVRAGLADLGLEAVHNPRLVRGLDYYVHTTFEFVTDHLGAQNAVVAGGRYDGLVAMLGGADWPGLGWAAGIERLALLAPPPPSPPRPLAMIAVGESEQSAALRCAQTLRAQGLPVEMIFAPKLKRALAQAAALGARAALILGEAERSVDAVVVRDLDSGLQQQVRIAALADHLAALGEVAGEDRRAAFHVS